MNDVSIREMSCVCKKGENVLSSWLSVRASAHVWVDVCVLGWLHAKEG